MDSSRLSSHPPDTREQSPAWGKHAGAVAAAPVNKETRGEASLKPALVDAASTPPVGELVSSGPDEKYHEDSTGGNRREEASSVLQGTRPRSFPSPTGECFAPPNSPRTAT